MTNVLVLALLCFASCLGQNATQPAPEGTSNGAPPSPESVLDAPNAVDVARVICTIPASKPPVPCPKSAPDVAKFFNQTLKLGSGNDSDLAKVLKELAGKSSSLFPASIDTVVIHLVDHRGQAAVTAVNAAIAEHESKVRALGPTPPPTEIAKLDRELATARETAAASGATPRDRWIVADNVRDEKKTTLGDKDRIYGKKRLGLLFVHVNAPMQAGSDATEAYGDLTYKAFVEPKLPENIKRLLTLLRIAGVAQSKLGARARLATTTLVGHGVLLDIDVPSDVTFFATMLDARKLVGTGKKYDNEGLYFWDASVAVPVNKATMLDYQEDGGGFIPKQINKQSIFGAINIYPWKVDIKRNTGPVNWMPRAIVGIGLTGRPGQALLVGGAWGFSQLQFFVGSGFYAHQVAATADTSASSANSTQRYASRFVYGINVPVYSAFKKITDKKN